MKVLIVTLLLLSNLFSYTVKSGQVPNFNNNGSSSSSVGSEASKAPTNYYQEVTLTPKDILITTQKFYDEFKGGHELLKKAEAYLVFPKVYEGGLVVGAKYGFGALVQNNAIANYYKIFSTSVGVQAGIQNYSLIVVFLTKESVKRFMNKEEWKISADGELSFTSWHQGVDVNSLDMKKDTIVIPFNNTGLMGGLSFEGTVFQKLQ